MKQTKKKKRKKKKAAEPRSDGYGNEYAEETIEVEGETIKCVDVNHEQFCAIIDSKVPLTKYQMMALSASRGKFPRNGEPGIRLGVNPKKDAKGNALTGSSKDKLLLNLKRYRNGSTNGKIVFI